MEGDRAETVAESGVPITLSKRDQQVVCGCETIGAGCPDEKWLTLGLKIHVV